MEEFRGENGEALTTASTTTWVVVPVPALVVLLTVVLWRKIRGIRFSRNFALGPEQLQWGALISKSKGEGGGSPGRGKGEGPLEKVQVLWICRGVGVFPSRVIQDKYRTWGAQNDRLVFSNKPD